MDNSKITLVETIDDIFEFKQWLGQKRNWLAFDLETEGLEFWKRKIRLFQFGDSETSWVFRYDRWSGILEEVLKTYYDKIVGHNIGFDYRFIKYYMSFEPPWDKTYDTLVMAHNLDPTKSKALKTLGAQFLSPEAKKLQTALNSAMKQQGWGWDTIPVDFPIYWGYAGVDCILTAKLAEQFWPQIESQYKNVFDLEMQVSRICSNMEIRGINLDLNYVEQSYEKLTNYCKLFEETFWNNFNMLPTQNDKVAQLLIDQGAQLSKLTATGRVSMDEEALSGVEHPLAKQLIEYRKAKKIANTYFKNFLEMHHNGIIHPSINTLGARTGRMSTNNPAAQTFPRGSIVRNCFVPFSEQSLYSIDYSGIEARLFSHFAGEEELIRVFHEGFDPHTYAAQQVFGVEEVTKEQRQIAKNCTFALLYGAGPEKMGFTAGISSSDAKAFIDAYKARFPGVAKFMKTVEKVATQRMIQDGRAWVKSPIGRIHYSDKSKIYTLVNSLVQGTSADVFKQALVNLDNAGYGEYMCLPIHDEVLFSFPHNVNIQDVVATMEDRNTFRVPLVCEASGPYKRWGEKYDT